MPLGLYGVQVWAEVLGGTTTGIASMAVTLYTPDTTGCFNPVAVAGTGNPGQGIPPNVPVSWQSPVVFGYATRVPAAYQYFNNPTLNPTNDIDAVQLSFGSNARDSFDPPGQGKNSNFAFNTPTLLATEAWNLTSLGTNGVTLSAYVAPTSACWTGSGSATAGFDNITTQVMVIPEPITMTMLGMGLSSLGMMIWRRRKETV
jgi:hypothetical protein